MTLEIYSQVIVQCFFFNRSVVSFSLMSFLLNKSYYSHTMARRSSMWVRSSVCVWCCFVLRHGYGWERPWGSCCLSAVPVQRSGFCSFTRRPVLPLSAGLSGETTSKIKLPETSLLLVSPEDWSRVGGTGKRLYRFETVVSQQESFLYHCEDKQFLKKKIVFISTLICLKSMFVSILYKGSLFWLLLSLACNFASKVLVFSF